MWQDSYEGADPASSTDDPEEGLGNDKQGVSEGLLPGLSQFADSDREGAVLPKQSDVTLHEEEASPQVSKLTFRADARHLHALKSTPNSFSSLQESIKKRLV